MTMNTKTPAMLLQEFTVKKKLAPPEYDLIVCNSGTHENEFQYKVIVANIHAIGVGRSKQVAKHDAAFKAIALLRQMGVYDVENTPLKDFNPQMHRNEPDNPFQVAINCIGTLQDICIEKKIPPPTFVEISDVGPPHCRQFTYECQLSSLKTQATANTKKQAKQLTAKKMLERIIDILPELVAESEKSRNAITNVDGEAHDKYSELSFFNVVSNKSAKVLDFQYCFVNLMEERNLNREDFKEYLMLRNDESLTKILKKLDLEHQFVPIQESPKAAVILNIDTDTPFCILGLGTSIDNAKNNAITDVFDVLDTYMTSAKIVY